MFVSGSARRAATADTTAILTSRAPSTRTTSVECSPTVATSSSASTCDSTSSCDAPDDARFATRLRAHNDASVTSPRRRRGLGHWRRRQIDNGSSDRSMRTMGDCRHRHGKTSQARRRRDGATRIWVPRHGMSVSIFMYVLGLDNDSPW